MMRRRIRGILLTALSFIALILPLAIVCIWKRDVWFAVRVETTKVSIGFILALIFALCMLNGAFKELDNRFTTIFTLGIIAVVILPLALLAAGLSIWLNRRSK